MLKKYQSHKVVEAFKIKEVIGIKLMDEQGRALYVDIDYLEKHRPREGGYFVKYEDGYQSFSPADAFESGYTELPSDNKVTKEQILNLIVDEQYHVFPGTTLTVCCLTLKNGYTITGESACVDPANFNAADGQFYAKEKAVDEIWKLEGYRLREAMYHQGK